MKHTFRLNVFRKGYTLVAGRSTFDCREFPLDVPSEGVSRNYLAAQKRIDHMLATQTARWHFCVANLHFLEPHVVAYGCLLPMEDDRGRSGISFVHAIESDEQQGIVDIAVRITQLLSHQTIAEISGTLAAIARGSESSLRVVDFLTSSFASPEPISTRLAGKSHPIREMRHDCGGASAVAWLAMTISHADIASPWELYEELNPSTGLISTRSSSIDAQAEHSLSTYVFETVRDRGLLAGPPALHTQQTAETTAAVVVQMLPEQEARPARTDSPGDDGVGAAAPASPPASVLTRPLFRTPLADRKERDLGVGAASDARKKAGREPKTRVVKVTGGRDETLYLSEDDRPFKLKAKRCRSITDHGSHYELNVLVPRLGGLWFKNNTLIVQKDALSHTELQYLAAFIKAFKWRQDFWMD